MMALTGTPIKIMTVAKIIPNARLTAMGMRN